MRKLIILSVLFTLLLSSNSCSLFKHTSKNTTLDDVKVKNDIEVKKDLETSKVTEAKGISENTNTVATEEVTYRKGSNEPIELTATFRIDTSSSMKGDTALKLVDIDNSDISVAIYQNKKTNELMAKISTGKSTKSVPFEELQIKKTYAQTVHKTDTSKKDSSSSHLLLDSTDKSKSKTHQETLNKTSEPSSKGMWTVIGLGALIVAGVLIYFLIKRK